MTLGNLVAISSDPSTRQQPSFFEVGHVRQDFTAAVCCDQEPDAALAGLGRHSAFEFIARDVFLFFF